MRKIYKVYVSRNIIIVFESSCCCCAMFSMLLTTSFTFQRKHRSVTQPNHDVFAPLFTIINNDKQFSEIYIFRIYFNSNLKNIFLSIKINFQVKNENLQVFHVFFLNTSKMQLFCKFRCLYRKTRIKIYQSNKLYLK